MPKRRAASLVSRWLVALTSIAGSLTTVTAVAAERTFDSYAAVAESDVPATVLLKVIAREGKSKRYDDLLPLDGGTVGIAHFAVGGLAPLYRHMDTKKYFDKTSGELIHGFSTACRPKGHSGNDTGWGCFSKPWWRNGMKAFLSSEESQQVQNDAWADTMQPVIKLTLSKGWHDARSIAIALGIANSVGRGGFASLAAAQRWNAEQVLDAYVGTNEHRRRRRQALDASFPRSR
jgi:hypothetical protein